MKKRCCERRLLDDHSLRSLLDTTIFYNGLFFTLRSGKEHRKLRFNPCQIQLVEISGQRSYLRYNENVSKIHPGGLKERIVSPKTVIHHTNRENPERCFVCLFKLYQTMCPPDAPPHAFYLQPLKNQHQHAGTPTNHLATLTWLIQLLVCANRPKFRGYKTNHSLRATVASCLYQASVDERLVMERTGHRSFDGIHSYKQTSDDQRQVLSDILNGEKSITKQTCISSDLDTMTQTAILSSFSSHISTKQQQALNLSSPVFNNCTVNFFVGTDQSEGKHYRRAIVINTDFN